MTLTHSPPSSRVQVSDLHGARAATLRQAAGWGIFALAAWGLSFSIEDPFAFGSGPKPTFWPRMIAILLFVATVCLAASAFMSNDRRNEITLETNIDQVPPVVSPSRLAAVVAPIMLYVLLCEYVGFLIATPVFLVAAMALINRGRVKSVWIAASATGVFSVLIAILVIAFNTPLPPGVGIFNTWNAELVNLLR